MAKVLHTIGYEGAVIADFLNTLTDAKIDLLIDVRDVPISRKKGFSKSSLAANLAEVGVDYLHLKGLGDPKPGRTAAREGRYQDFEQIYYEHLGSAAAQSDMARGVEASKIKRACLLCFEKVPQRCHRTIVARKMSVLGGFRVVHLGVSSLASGKARRAESAYDGVAPIIG